MATIRSAEIIGATCLEWEIGSKQGGVQGLLCIFKECRLLLRLDYSVQEYRLVNYFSGRLEVLLEGRRHTSIDAAEGQAYKSITTTLNEL
jgi:hypothetical protein